MNYLQKFTYCLLATALLSSCIKDGNPPIPAYIHVPSIQFIPGDTLVEGSSRHKFTNVWISIDGQLIGVDDIPAILPGMISDTASTQVVKVFAGLDENGISSSKSIYPFFDPYEVTLDLKQGKIDTLYPQFRYRTDAKFIIIEDFETPGVVFGNDLDQYPDSDVIKQTDDVFEGQYSGQLLMDTLSPDCYASTTFRYGNLQLPSTASGVWLEIHYKTNVPITVGLIAHRSGVADEYFEKGGMNTIEGWNKIYFDLTEDIYGLNAQEYSVYLRSAIIGTDIKNPKVYIDNIKLVHF